MTARSTAWLLPALLLATTACDRDVKDAPAPSPAWDGEPIREADAVITLELPAPALSIQINGAPATTVALNESVSDKRRVRVLIASDETGIRCENTIIVTFALLDAGTLLANHCHGDDTFEIRPGEIVNALLTKEDVDDPADDMGPPPGEALQFEWSANGFEQLPARYKWLGGTLMDTRDGFVSLGVPETDDIVMNGSCKDGMIVSDYYLMPEVESASRAFRMEVGGAYPTHTYTATIVSGEPGPRYRLKQHPDDAIFDEIAGGEWLYLAVDRQDGTAARLRVSLKGAQQALAPILASCREPRE